MYFSRTILNLNNFGFNQEGFQNWTNESKNILFNYDLPSEIF